jgi:hypothetical protein
VQGDTAKNIGLWYEALSQKYDGGLNPYGRKEFDKLMGDFDVRMNLEGSIIAPFGDGIMEINKS